MRVLRTFWPFWAALSVATVAPPLVAAEPDAFETAMYRWDYTTAFCVAVDSLESLSLRQGLRRVDARRGDAHYRIGLVFRAAGRKEWAELQFRHALRIRRAADAPEDAEMAVTIAMLASARYEQRDPEGALALAARARKMVDATGADSPQRATVYRVQASLLRRTDPDEAIRLYRRALKMDVSHFGASHPASVDAYCWFAHLQQRYGHPAEAESLLVRAQELATTSVAAPLGVVSPISAALGALRHNTGCIADAERLFVESIAARDRSRDRSPAWFGLRRHGSGIDGRLAVLLLDQGRDDEAWSALASGMGWVTAAMRPDTTAATSILRRRMFQLERRALAQARLCGDVHVCGDAAAHESLHLRYLLALRDVLRARDGAGAVPARSDAWRDQLAQDEALVGWFDCLMPVNQHAEKGRFVSFAYVVRRNGPVHWIKLADCATRSQWELAVAPRLRARGLIASASTWPMRVVSDASLDDALKSAGHTFFSRMEPELDGVTRLIASTEMLDNGVPLECLRTSDGEYVGERYDVTYVPSLEFIRAGDDSCSVSIIIGNASGSEGAPGLAFAGREIDAICDMFPTATVLDGADVTEARLDEAFVTGGMRLRGAVHIVTHGSIDTVEPERSLLTVVAPTTVGSALDEVPWRDGFVTTREIQSGWRVDAPVVTLSACRSGRGALSFGDGPLGFCQAFFAAGAERVVASLWDVDDEASSRLMVRFYRALSSGASPAAALRRARHDLRTYTASDGSRPFEHPVYWAGFVVSGVSH